MKPIFLPEHPILPMITFTNRAREMVLSFLGDDEESSQALRIRVRMEKGSAEFDLTLVDPEERTEEEREVNTGDFSVYVLESDVEAIEGSTVDYVDRVNASGFEVHPATASAPESKAKPGKGEPSGEIAERVRDVLDSQVNPAIASHGGLISLVNVEDTEIYVQMSGGCQGCAWRGCSVKPFPN
jgi:Fe/S biogenesis protein NfuA